MSRIGKKPISIPQGVDVTVNDRLVTVKGPKGVLTVMLHPVTSVRLAEDGRSLEVTVEHDDSPSEKALWGLMRQLIANAVQGVQKAYEKTLEFVGVGFKVAVSGKTVNMDVGFSHPVAYALPEGIEAKVEKQILTITGIDKQLVGEVAAQIRRVKPPEPYKGKGIRYTTETVRRKAGKAATKGS